MSIILFSPGEPAGIGPDLIIKLVTSNQWESINSKIVCLGDNELFQARSRLINKKIKIRELKSLDTVGKNKKGVLQLYKVSNCADFSPKKLNPRNARYVIDHLDFGIKYCNVNKKVGLVTGPIQKSNIIDAGDLLSSYGNSGLMI